MTTRYTFTVEGDDYEEIYKNTLDELERFFGVAYVLKGDVTWTVDVQQGPVQRADGKIVLALNTAEVTATYKEPQ